MTTLTDILSSARRYPDRAAFRLTRPGRSAESLTYARLFSEAEVLAEALRRRGTGPVLTDARRTADSVKSVLACLMAGRPYVPLSPSFPPARLKTMARLTRASFLLAPADFPDMDVPRACAEDLLRETALPPESPRPSAGEPQDAENTAYILFTSGSTGEPKGVPISRRNLDSFTLWIRSLEPFRNADGMTVFGHALFSFDLSAADLYLSLCGGHTLAAFEGEGDRMDAALAALAQGADTAVMTPAFLRMLLLDRNFTAERYPRLRTVYLCGETLPPKTARRALAAFPELCLLNAYGPTEAASAVCAARITPDMADALPSLPIGDLSRTAADIRVEDGEIVLRGDSVFGGYLPGTAAEANSGAFRENGVNGYRTGDLGEIRDGLLWFRGRRDSQVKYKGYRIETGDIEENLSALPGVADCAVVPKRSASGDILALSAFVVPDPAVLPHPADPGEAARAEAELKAALAGRIPSYMIPKTIRFLPRLPATENGKTDRGALLTL